MFLKCSVMNNSKNIKIKQKHFFFCYITNCPHIYKHIYIYIFLFKEGHMLTPSRFLSCENLHTTSRGDGPTVRCKCSLGLLPSSTGISSTLAAITNKRINLNRVALYTQTPWRIQNRFPHSHFFSSLYMKSLIIPVIVITIHWILIITTSRYIYCT